jgi:hypothetical protein
MFIQQMVIHSKETKQISRKSSTYSTSATNRIQGTINRIKIQNRKTTEYTETTKHENKEKATAGN